MVTEQEKCPKCGDELLSHRRDEYYRAEEYTYLCGTQVKNFDSDSILAGRSSVLQHPDCIDAERAKREAENASYNELATILGTEDADEAVERVKELMELPTITPKRLATWFHNAYENRAPGHGWKTNVTCQVPFDLLPPANRALMLGTAEVVLHRLKEEMADALKTEGKAEDGLDN